MSNMSPVAPREDHSGYFPNTELLGHDEMRCTVLGSGMPNQRLGQASASWLVELGNGDKFIFDLGSGAASRLGALEIPYDWVDKVFVTHWHQDHVGDIPALWIGGWTGGRQGKSLRIWGPSGEKKELGTEYMVDGIRRFMSWDVISRNGKIPKQGGVIEAHEFDYKTMNKPIYEENGVVIRAFPAVHEIDGAVSYSLEWKGLKFVYSGDDEMNKWFLEYAKDADIAIHECFHTMDQMHKKYRFIPEVAIDVATHGHTAPALFGAGMDIVKPKMAVAWHFYNEPDTRYDIYEEIRRHYDGPLSMADDLMVYNVTKDSVKVRQAVVSPQTWPTPTPHAPIEPDPADLRPQTSFTKNGLDHDFINKVMEPEIKAFKKRHGVD